MNREELENRSTSELIDLILQQQMYIAQLQEQAVELQTRLAQLQLSARNGDAALASAADAVVQRNPFGLKLLLGLVVVFGCAVALIVTTVKPASFASVGRVEGFPIGSVTPLRLPTANQADLPVPIFLVHDPLAGFLALYQRDPRSFCEVKWNAAAVRFEDLCSGSQYSRTGEPFAEPPGEPASRGLDRYPVMVTEGGEVKVNLNELQPGPVMLATTHP